MNLQFIFRLTLDNQMLNQCLNLLLKPSYVSEHEDTDTRKNLNVPLSTNLDDAINIVIKDGFVIDIPIIIDNQKVNFLDVNITDNITISGLAVRIFLNN